MKKNIKYKKTVYLMKKFSPNTVAPNRTELQLMIKELTTVEMELYIEIKFMALEDPHPVEFNNDKLAKRLHRSNASIRKTKTTLKQKGWMIIKTFKDYDGNSRADVYMGKEQVALYNQGISLEIVNSKHYANHANRFKINEADISEDELVKRVNNYNKFCEDLND